MNNSQLKTSTKEVVSEDIKRKPFGSLTVDKLLSNLRHGKDKFETRRAVRLIESARIDEMMEFDQWTFDQTERGWASLSPNLQIEALRAYVDKNINGGNVIKPPSDKVFDPGLIFWRLGQVLALRWSADNKEAIDWMERSLKPKDPEWNDYANATIAFLKNDRVSFDIHSQSKNYNRSSLDRLKNDWGKTYREAY